MGKDEDEMSVLNSNLQVKGINNLRVFDVSMMPNIIAANTNAPAMAIADKATDTGDVTDVDYQGRKPEDPDPNEPVEQPTASAEEPTEEPKDETDS